MVKWEDVGCGFLAGLLVAVGGAIKDAPYEGFSLWTFLRSPVVAAVEAPLLRYAAGPKAPPWGIGLMSIGSERLTVELYKILRTQSGYAPSKFSVGEWGNPHWSTEEGPW